MMYRTQSAIFLALSFCFQLHGSAQIRVTADFPGGSAVVVSTDAASQSVHVQPQVRQERGWPCWWYFQLHGLSIGKPVSVTVSASSTPFRAGRVLSPTWLLPDSASISSDNIHWQHTPKAESDDRKAVYTFEATAETMWVAWGPPFLPSHAEALLRQISESLPDSELFVLARTRGDRPVHAIRFGARSDDAGKPSAIWIQARQHAWETGSSWVAQGFLNWVASDDPVAIELRNKATICVVPIMDVDNVADGTGGKDAVPRDHNRDWDDDPVYPEVRAAQMAIKKLNASHRFDLFIDLHNPSPNDRQPYFYGPKLDRLSQVQYRNYIRWKAIAESQIDALEPDYRFTSYIKSQQELDRVSKNWVRNHTSPQVVSLTLETAWNRPQGSQQGYQQVGKQLGLTIARYLSADAD
ncbi:hypothetical protein FYK55_14350 [Roseiconus nitratireducens]|uniref:Peptidase M14 domain-containing protein n=1 Tax=Roseiconus nitratireducens TaxID=2605748 RepID=A0A5M6D7S4_9BACT|nr:M14-type cytosolic carboxypeptidase [Roseiconus nitratireducens]KAA5542706.1 hypothetical protein FYK55_14350 [Roseiconus nitratireducens]